MVITMVIACILVLMLVVKARDGPGYMYLRPDGSLRKSMVLPVYGGPVLKRSCFKSGSGHIMDTSQILKERVAINDIVVPFRTDHLDGRGITGMINDHRACVRGCSTYESATAQT